MYHISDKNNNISHSILLQREETAFNISYKEKKLHLTTPNTPHTSKHTKISDLYTLNKTLNAYTLLQSLHTRFYIVLRKINRLIQAITPSINTSEASITKTKPHNLAQLRTNKSPFILSYAQSRCLLLLLSTPPLMSLERSPN